MIPPRLIRTIPAEVNADTEALWDKASALHPDWDHVTYRDPIPPDWFPLTGQHWSECQNGAQLAGLIRLEALWFGGGVYIDSDVELYRPLDSLLGLRGFAAWEDRNTVPDAVLGAEPHHPGIGACLRLAIERLRTADRGWRFAWETGPGVTTAILPNRDDFALLPPGSFYPVHYTEKDQLAAYQPEPWVFGVHLWHASWL